MDTQSLIHNKVLRVLFQLLELLRPLVVAEVVAEVALHLQMVLVYLVDLVEVAVEELALLQEELELEEQETLPLQIQLKELMVDHLLHLLRIPVLTLAEVAVEQLQQEMLVQKMVLEVVVVQEQQVQLMAHQQQELVVVAVDHN